MKKVMLSLLCISFCTVWSSAMPGSKRSSIASMGNIPDADVMGGTGMIRQKQNIAQQVLGGLKKVGGAARDGAGRMYEAAKAKAKYSLATPDDDTITTYNQAKSAVDPQTLKDIKRLEKNINKYKKEANKYEQKEKKYAEKLANRNVGNISKQTKYGNKMNEAKGTQKTMEALIKKAKEGEGGQKGLDALKTENSAYIEARDALDANRRDKVGQSTIKLLKDNAKASLNSVGRRIKAIVPKKSPYGAIKAEPDNRMVENKDGRIIIPSDQMSSDNVPLEMSAISPQPQEVKQGAWTRFKQGISNIKISNPFKREPIQISSREKFLTGEFSSQKPILTTTDLESALLDNSQPGESQRNAFTVEHYEAL